MRGFIGVVLMFDRINVLRRVDWFLIDGGQLVRLKAMPINSDRLLSVISLDLFPITILS